MMDQQSNHTPELNERDLELLSAYIDEQLSAEERSALEKRLRDEAFLRSELQAMQRTVALVRALPAMQASRNFTLSAADAARIQQEEPPQRIFRPAFGGRWIAGIAAAFVIVLVGIAVVLPSLSPGGDSEPQTMSVAQQPTEIAAPEIAEAEAAEEDFAADEASAGDGIVDQEQSAQTERVFSPTETALEAIQPTPMALTTIQPTFGVPRVGMTATAAAPQVEAAEQDSAGLGSNAVGATATALLETSIAQDDGTTGEEGQALGGMAGGAAPESDEAAASDTEEEPAAESSLMMDQAEAEEPSPEVVPYSAPQPQLPEPEALLQFALRWLIFFLQSLGS